MSSFNRFMDYIIGNTYMNGFMISYGLKNEKETLSIRKEIKTVCVPGGGYTGGRTYRAYSEGDGSSYTGGGYTGGGSYSGYSGDKGLYRGHSRGYGGVYGGGYSV
eukprot:77469_1